MLFNKKLDKKDKTKKGFTLVELLAVIVVIILISGVGIITYLKTINNSKSKATLLAINNIKEAAYLYSKEGTDEIEWVNSYDKKGKESGKYACVSVQQLINKGYFKDNFLDKEIYKNSNIDKKTFIKVSMGTNNDNLKVVVNKNDNTKDKCIGSAINGDLFHLRLGNDSKSYTDTIKLKFSPKDNSIKPKNYIVSIDSVSKKEESTTGEVTFKKLTNSTSYKIKACMITQKDNYYCDSFDISTKDFIKPKFTIDSRWRKEKTININYYDTNIFGKGSHYFTSEVSGKVKSGNIYSCDKENLTCNSTTTNEIVSDGYYKLGESNKEISFTTTDNIDKGVSKKLTAIIKDSANNSDESSGAVKKIDRVPPTCQILNAPSGWVGKNFELKSSCSDSGSGCSKNSYVTKVSSSSKQTITVRDKVGNTSTCSAYVMVDTTPPTCNVSVDGGVKGNQINNTNEYWYKEGTSSSNPVKVTIGCNDENGCEQDSVSGGSFYTDGERKYSKEIKDKFGNTTTCSGTIKIDTKKPSCTNSGGSSDWTNTDVTIKGICNDNGGSGCVKKDDSYDNDGNVSKIIRNEGEHTKLSPGTVYDKAGNPTLCKSDRIVKIDKTSPTCTVSSKNSDWTNQDVTVTGTCSDDKSGCKEKTISVTEKSNIDKDVSPGTVYDKAGNKKTCGTKKVKIDKTPPEIRIKSDGIKVKQYHSKTVPYNSSEGKEFTFWYKDSGGSGVNTIVAQVYTMNGKKVCCKSKDGDWKSGELCSAHANDKANKWWRAYRITDNAGNYSKIICYYHTNTSDVTKKKGDFTTCTVSGHTFK